MIYFDSAATSFQKPPSVISAVTRTMKTCSSVGRGGYAMAQTAAETVFSCRETAARLFDCTEEQVVFTSNATHGLNLAIHALVRPGDRVVISGFEHNAVTRPLRAAGAQIRVVGNRLFDPQGLLEDLERELRGRPAAVVCTQVSNVFGYVLPIEEVAALCRQYGLPLVIDASQAAGSLPVSLKRTGACFIAFPGHKGLYGPQGTGLLLCADGGEPLLYGGTGSASLEQTMPEFLPDRLEAGTHNVCGLGGLLAGMRYVLERTPEKILAGERALTALLKKELEKLPRIQPYFGEGQSGVVSFRVEDMDCEEAGQRLGEAGFAVRSGLHCAPLAHETAGTLAEGTVRVSFSDFNRPQEVLLFAQSCKKLFPA